MKKKALFIDRDGTLIVEPTVTYQIDSLEQLEFIPKVIRNLYKITDHLDFDLVMVSNQDGLGTDAYPEESFNLIQSKLLKTLENEGIVFDDIIIDRSMPEEKLPTRKPGTALLSEYIKNYDLANSYVIGDRITDIELAKNLNCIGILLNNENLRKEIIAKGLERYCALITTDWDEIYRFIALPSRSAKIVRKTNETDISVIINLDGNGTTNISTGLGFLDHMLEQIGRHAGMDLTVTVKGDLKVDEHHTMEDTGLALGEAVYNAIGNKLGMNRYGFCLPMDDCLAQVALDFSGRPWFVWNAVFKREKVGDVPTEMFYHFFKSFSDAARCNLNIKAEGENEHHKIEAIFKAVAKSIKMAVNRDINNMNIPSTKGVL
jgi:imidazoleglycerol-phosphate dehydratase/histidinol-phosphatase